jgi:von Willebrand factor type A domain
MLRLAAPQWLLLLPVLAALAWQLPRMRLWSPLRAGCVVLLVLCLARPEIRRLASGVDLWVLVDRSDSAQESVEPRRNEMERILAANRRAADRLYFVDFASSPVLRDPAAPFEARSTETRLRLAVEFALAMRTRDRASRILVLTDGMSTETLTGLAEQLKASHVPLDVRLLSSPPGEDYGIESIRAPERVRLGEGFLIEIRATGTHNADVPYEVLCDEQKAGAGMMHIRGGKALVRMAARSTTPGAHKYELRLLPASDVRVGNNVASWWVEVTQGPNVLLVTAFADDPLAEALRSQGMDVEAVTEASRLHAGSLSGPRAVLINNVPAHKLPADFLEALDFFVTAQGGGLLMAGGRFSFGSGGYFQSPLDSLLPVSMELRQEHRRLAVAMAIVLDRSGSMAAGAGAGITKMDLANEGAARAIGLLGPSDAVTVLAVDSEPHIVIPLSRIGPDAQKMSDDVRRIQSAGGGIFVYAGLEAAWKELEKSSAGQRHIVLFADAADAEEPGQFRELLATMTAAGTTVSVIGLGTSQDADASLLEEIGTLGKGRVFFSEDAAQLPGIFTQETVAVARSAFLTESVAVVDAGGWPEIGVAPIALPPVVDAYNLSYLRPEAAALAVTGDEYKAPLVAFWQRGAGRVVAVSFPLAGEYSSTIRAWARASDFERTLVRWLLPAGPSGGASLRTSVSGEELQVELMHDEAWTRRLAENPPRLIAISGTSKEPFEVPWEKIEPGRYVVRIPTPAGSWLKGVVIAGTEKWPFGPIAAGVDPEWNASIDRIRELREVSRLSQGREIMDLRDAWQQPPDQGYSRIDNWLRVLLLGLFLAEVAATRIRGAQ